MMNAHIAGVEGPDGSPQARLAALNIQEAQASELQPGKVQAKDGAERHVQYAVREQSHPTPPEAVTGLFRASGALVACLLVFVIAIVKLRRHFKG